MKNLSLYQQIILLTLTFFVLAIIVAIFHEEGILTVHEFENELIEFEVSNKTLKQKNQKLRFEVEALKSDPLSIEILAREKLNMVRSGETVYQLVPLEKNHFLPVEKLDSLILK
jgi:cell division protein FtsB